MSLRIDFIETPLYNVLLEGTSVINCNTSHGIETYPTFEYLLQSIFLRMTGFSEQKLRAIHWYFVNADLDLRYKTLKGGTESPKFGEYSNLKDKQKFYTSFMTIVKETTETEISIDDACRTLILNRVKSQISNISDTPVFKEAFSKELKETKALLNSITINHFAKDKVLLNSPLTDIYEFLYKQRNKSAHYSTSYQRDIDTFRSLLNPHRAECNYFTYFAILLILDEVFMEFYNQAKMAYNNAF